MATQPTTIILDEARHFRMRSSDLILFEEQIGKGWLACLAERSEKQLVYFFWAGLRWRDDRLTPQKMSEIIDAARERGVSVADMWDGVGRMLQNSNILPQAVQNGHPSMTAASTPDPSSGAPATSQPG